MKTRFSATDRPAQRGHPEGGYALIPVWQLCQVWDAYKRSAITFADVRLWLAACEAQERRCGLEEGRVGFYSSRELERLTGCSERITAGSVKRLKAEGLLTLTSNAISFGSRMLDIAGVGPSLALMLSHVKNHRRAIPIPRRTLRMLAQCRRPAVIATALGHLFRCVYYRAGEVVSWGRCKSSWVAETFKVDNRSVKAARAHLIGLNWLVKLDGNGGHVTKRWGGQYQVSLTWARPESYTSPATPHNGCMEFSPDRPRNRTEISPCKHKNPLPTEEIQNQKPAVAGPPGVKIEEGRRAEKRLLGEPRLQHVEREDLADTRRTLELFDQATRANLITGSEHGRLQFVSLAEHALLHGTLNPCGLFVKLLRDKKFHYITLDDEEAARSRINRELYQVTRERPIKSKVSAQRVEIPQDVRIAQAIDQVAAQKKLSPITVMRAMKLDWTLTHYNELLQTAEDARLRQLGNREEMSGRSSRS